MFWNTHQEQCGRELEEKRAGDIAVSEQRQQRRRGDSSGELEFGNSLDVMEGERRFKKQQDFWLE